jgi:hypothetical protein
MLFIITSPSGSTTHVHLLQLLKSIADVSSGCVQTDPAVFTCSQAWSARYCNSSFVQSQYSMAVVQTTAKKAIEAEPNTWTSCVHLKCREQQLSWIARTACSDHRMVSAPRRLRYRVCCAATETY